MAGSPVLHLATANLLKLLLSDKEIAALRLERVGDSEIQQQVRGFSSEPQGN